MRNSLSASERQDLARKLAADEFEDELVDALLNDVESLIEQSKSGV